MLKCKYCGRKLQPISCNDEICNWVTCKCGETICLACGSNKQQDIPDEEYNPETDLYHRQCVACKKKSCQYC